MTDANNPFVAAVANSGVMEVTAWAAPRLNQAAEAEVTVLDERKDMGWMMAVGILQQTCHAQIVVLTVAACNHSGYILFYRKEKSVSM